MFGRARPHTCRVSGWLTALAAVLFFIAFVGMAGVAGASTKKHPTKTTVAPRPIGHAVTLKYFAATATTKLTTAKGKALRPGAQPVKGDRLEVVQDDFVGTQAKHARHYQAVDRLRCVYTNATSATCTDVITVSGSEIVSKHQAALFAGPITSFAITGGTGRYHGARGLITATALGPKTATLSIVVLPGTS